MSERPKITPTHATFHKQIGMLAGAMADAQVFATREYLGEPPSEECRDMLFDLFAESVHFGDDAISGVSHHEQASIAGSDTVTFKSIALPGFLSLEPGMSYRERSFPGRIIDLYLHYGIPSTQSSHYRLYTGPETPPALLTPRQPIRRYATIP